MPATFSRPNQTLAVARINKLLGRVFSVAAPLVGLQMVLNALSQAPKLDPFWFWISLGLMVFSQLAFIYSVWVRGNEVLWYRAIVFSTLFALATWPVQVGDGLLQHGEKPWFWWSVGIASIASVGGFSIGVAILLNLALPTIWFSLEISGIGGSIEPLVAVQDSVMSLLFAGVISVLVGVLRYESSMVDEANQKANLAAIELAKVDAIERERARVNALVHDSVLTTLLVAANARNFEEEQSAAQLATAAIHRLESAKSELATAEAISINSLFSALEVAVHRQAPEVEVDIEGSTDEQVPGEVAAALTESTLQALANSLQHAGRGVLRQIFLRGTKRGLKIVVKDNGRGFRPSRVPTNRLGLRLSIISRIEAVGGKVFIDSKPGAGANIVIEWAKP